MLDNYEKKLKNFDLNYYNISNLEKQINFNFLQLNYNENISLDKKIEIIIHYLNQNLNAQFIFDDDKMDNLQSIEKINEINGVIYENIRELNKEVRHFSDLNKDLFIFCIENVIYLLSKVNFETKIKIIESEIKDIKYCKKIDDEKFLIQIPNYILIIKVINNTDYMIIQKYELPSNNYSFNSKFDIIYTQAKKEPNNYYYIYFNTYSNIIKNSSSYYEQYVGSSGEPQFINDNHFFYFCKDILTIYEITYRSYGRDFANKIKSIKLDYNYKYACIIDLNKSFYCMNDGRKILLLNKDDLTLSKTISMNNNNLGLFKISDNNISIFFESNNKLVLNNYDILMAGLNWNLTGSKNIINEEVYRVEKSNNYFICRTNKACFLFEIKNK